MKLNPRKILSIGVTALVLLGTFGAAAFADDHDRWRGRDRDRDDWQRHQRWSHNQYRNGNGWGWGNQRPPKHVLKRYKWYKNNNRYDNRYTNNRNRGGWWR